VKLLTKEIEKLLPAIRATSALKAEEVKVPLKFFHPFSTMRWYVTELDPETGEMFGYVTGGAGDELGYLPTLDEFKALRVRGLPVERDLSWDPETPLSEVMVGRAV
jgi:hypothetical protein